MAEDELSPALTPEEWARLLPARAQLLGSLRSTPYSSHALAALLLYDEPFGFTQLDVDDETQVAAYCDKMAGESDTLGDERAATLFRTLGGRHRLRAARIAALLPPPAPPPVGEKVPPSGTKASGNGHGP